MALKMIEACDCYQLRLFVPMLLVGLRAAEPCFLFSEFLDTECLRVPCVPELGYATKGRRDKRFPLLEDLHPFWKMMRANSAFGMLYVRRDVERSDKTAPLRALSLKELTAVYRDRCEASQIADASRRSRLRDEILTEAGALRYDDIHREFQTLARKLTWPPEATLKDLRHLFATTMNNASLPEAYRRYLMGHSPEKSAITAYTHLTELRRHYAEAVHREWASLIDAVNQRMQSLAVVNAQ